MITQTKQGSKDPCLPSADEHCTVFRSPSALLQDMTVEKKTRGNRGEPRYNPNGNKNTTGKPAPARFSIALLSPLASSPEAHIHFSHTHGKALGRSTERRYTKEKLQEGVYQEAQPWIRGERDRIGFVDVWSMSTTAVALVRLFNFPKKGPSLDSAALSLKVAQGYRRPCWIQTSKASSE